MFSENNIQPDYGTFQLDFAQRIVEHARSVESRACDAAIHQSELNERRVFVELFEKIGQCLKTFVDDVDKNLENLATYIEKRENYFNKFLEREKLILNPQISSKIFLTPPRFEYGKAYVGVEDVFSSALPVTDVKKDDGEEIYKGGKIRKKKYKGGERHKQGGEIPKQDTVMLWERLRPSRIFSVNKDPKISDLRDKLWRLKDKTYRVSGDFLRPIEDITNRLRGDRHTIQDLGMIFERECQELENDTKTLKKYNKILQKFTKSFFSKKGGREQNSAKLLISVHNARLSDQNGVLDRLKGRKASVEEHMAELMQKLELFDERKGELAYSKIEKESKRWIVEIKKQAKSMKSTSIKIDKLNIQLAKLNSQKEKLVMKSDLDSKNVSKIEKLEKKINATTREVAKQTRILFDTQNDTSDLKIDLSQNLIEKMHKVSQMRQVKYWKSAHNALKNEVKALEKQIKSVDVSVQDTQLTLKKLKYHEKSQDKVEKVGEFVHQKSGLVVFKKLKDVVTDFFSYRSTSDNPNLMKVVTDSHVNNEYHVESDDVRSKDVTEVVDDGHKKALEDAKSIGKLVAFSGVNVVEDRSDGIAEGQEDLHEKHDDGIGKTTRSSTISRQ